MTQKNATCPIFIYDDNNKKNEFKQIARYCYSYRKQ